MAWEALAAETGTYRVGGEGGGGQALKCKGVGEGCGCILHNSATCDYIDRHLGCNNLLLCLRVTGRKQNSTV